MSNVSEKYIESSTTARLEQAAENSVDKKAGVKNEYAEIRVSMHGWDI